MKNAVVPFNRLPFLLFFLMPNFLWSQVKDINKYVPVIETVDSFDIEGAGAGLIVGYDDFHLFIVTALHVVDQKAEVKVSVWPTMDHAFAHPVYRNEDLDLAVIYVEGDVDPKMLSSLHLKMDESFSIAENIFSIGHPYQKFWQVNRRNTILQMPTTGQKRDFFETTPEAIVPGCSGGPVFDEKNLLAGILLEGNEINANCLKASTIIKKLEERKIPCNLLLSTEEWWLGLSEPWKRKLGDAVNKNMNLRIFSGQDLVNPSQQFLEGLRTIKRFECRNCGIRNLELLARLPELEELILPNNEVRNLAPLNDLRNLKLLDLANNDVRSLAPLSQSFELREIDLRSNASLQDLTPLKNLTNLEKLNFSQTDIRSIDSLGNLNQLKVLSILLTDIPVKEQKRLKEKLPSLRIAFRNRREGVTQLLYNRNMGAEYDDRPTLSAAGDRPDNTRGAFVAFNEQQISSFHLSQPKKSTIERPLVAVERPVIKETKPVIAAPVEKSATPPSPIAESEPKASLPPPPIEVAEEIRPKTSIAIDKKRALEQNNEESIADEEKTIAGEVPETNSSLEQELREFLLKKDFQKVEQMALTKLGEAPDNHAIRAFLIIAYLGQNQFEKSRRLWFIFKNRQLENGQKFSDRLIEELTELKARGLSSPMLTKFQNVISK